MISKLVQKHVNALQDEQDKHWESVHAGKLSVSEIGGCPRMAMLRLHGVEVSDPPDDFLKRLFWSGKHAETKMEEILRLEYGDRVVTQQVIETDAFIGRPDFVILNTSPDDPNAFSIQADIIVEHKETNYNRFKYKNLPMNSHVLQAAAYGWFMRKDKPDIYLYYQNQANHACFRVIRAGDCVQYTGHINGNRKDGEIATTVVEEVKKILKWYNADEIPPRYHDPFQVNGHCASIYGSTAYPRCKYYNHCWAGTEYEGAERLKVA